MSALPPKADISHRSADVRFVPSTDITRSPRRRGRAPFFFIGEVQPALRVSNAIAIVMLFLCGYAFARCAGLRAWPTGLLMVAIGCAMVGVATLLGG